MDLLDAADVGNLDCVRMLVEQGADKDEGDSNGYTPLYIATRYGHLQMVLVEQGASLDKTNEDRETPLSEAAYIGQLEVVRFLLEQGADRDKASNGGWTPLHWAAMMGHLKITMLLMSYGADLNARTNYGKLPIDLARNEEIKQAIRDEPRRRMDEAPGKRATEQDRHANVAISASACQEDEEDAEGEKQCNKRPRLDEGVVAAAVAEEETKVAEEDEDSEPSSDEEHDN